MTENGWNESAAAWIADLGEHGDFGRRYVLDPIMLPRAIANSPKTALDVGCGEGRFCRMLQAHGVDATGVDPTPALLDQARKRDTAGSYIEASGDALPFDNESYDLVVSYLSLIDMPATGWVRGASGEILHYPVDYYLDARAFWTEWRDIRIVNHHRPLTTYMRALLSAGLTLEYFEEPAPIAGAPEPKAERYRRAPWFLVMEWRK